MGGKMYRFEKLQVWQKAMECCKLVYQKSKNFPKEEIYGLTSQLRRAAISVPLNIAEGSACQTTKGFIQFLTIALRSQYETVTIIKLAHLLKFLTEPEYKGLENNLGEIGKLLQGLINSLKKKSNDKKSKNQRLITNN
jgi:four helix bundle protein